MISKTNNPLTVAALPYPKFLAFDLSGFNFDLSGKKVKKTKPDDYYKEKLLKEFEKPDTLILFNGKVIFNNISELNITTLNTDENYFENYKNSTSDDKLVYLNKQYLNSAQKIVFTNNVNNLKINIVISASRNLSHYTSYELSEDINVNITEEFVLFKNAKLNYNMHANLRENAKLNLLYLEYFKNNGINVLTHNIEVNNNSKADLYYLNLISANSIHNSSIKLIGKDAQCLISSVSFANKDNKHGLLQNAKHLSRETNSLINNVAIVNNNATMVIDGVNIIEKGFSKSQAEQKSKIVNLSDEAKSVANPQLIINEYDVEAGHAAAVGRIDEDQLYYLMSRGLTKQQSIELLVDSFVNEIFEMINNNKKIKKLKKIIKSKIN